jgi:hypothetical protein
MRKCVLALGLLCGCVDTGPVYVPQFQRMDATPYMRQDPPPQQQMKVCPNGLIVQQYYLC